MVDLTPVAEAMFFICLSSKKLELLQFHFNQNLTEPKNHFEWNNTNLKHTGTPTPSPVKATFANTAYRPLCEAVWKYIPTKDFREHKPV